MESTLPGANNQGRGGQNNTFGLFTLIFLILGIVAIYYLYHFLYASSDNKAVLVAGPKRGADMPLDKPPTIPPPYEGGEYSVNTWIYISSFNKNRNTRKHIFELKGTYFSTLLIGLGAYNNTLIVRTHTQDAGALGNAATGAAAPAGATPSAVNTQLRAGQSTTGVNPYVTGNTGAGSMPAAAPPATGGGASTTPPNVSDAMSVGNLSASSINNMFAPTAMNDSLLTTPPSCDLAEIDLQRWTMVTVVLSGRTIDVYMDGKLSRSCMAPSYFKVDPTGVKAMMTERGGFDGYTANTSVANYAMNPDEIYRAYLLGPEGVNMDILSWFVSLFKGSA
jgi:hypothetical protein